MRNGESLRAKEKRENEARVQQKVAKNEVRDIPIDPTHAWGMSI